MFRTAGDEKGTTLRGVVLDADACPCNGGWMLPAERHVLRDQHVWVTWVAGLWHQGKRRRMPASRRANVDTPPSDDARCLAQPNPITSGTSCGPLLRVLGERPTDVLYRPVPEGSRPCPVSGEEHLVSGTGEDQEGRAGLVGDAEAHGHVAAHE
jgi:hypothetical protein